MTMPEPRRNSGFDLKILAATAVKNKISQVMKEVRIPPAQSQNLEKFEKEAEAKTAAFQRQAAHIVESLDAIVETRDFKSFDAAYLGTKDNTEHGHSFYRRAMINNRVSLDTMLEVSWREQRPDHERAASIHHRDDDMLAVQKGIPDDKSIFSKAMTIFSRLRWAKPE